MHPSRFVVAVVAVTLLSLSSSNALSQAPMRPVYSTVSVLRLDDLLREALSNNPALHATRAEADALRARIPQVSSLPDPTAGLAYQPAPVFTARGTQRTQWRVEQMIPFPGKLGLRGEIADREAGEAGAEAEALAQDLVFGIKLAYDELYRVQEQFVLVEEFQNELRVFEDAAVTRYEVGSGMQQAILKAQIERTALSVRLEKLAEEQRTALETLARLLNRPNLNGLAGSQVVPRTVDDIDHLNLLQWALASRPEADAARFEIERAEKRTALARREFLPDFMFSINYFDIGPTESMSAADGRDAVALNVGVRVPLWFDRLKGRLEEARAERRQADARFEALKTAFRTEIDDLTHRRQRQKRRLELLEASLVPQAQTALEATLSAYTTGRTDFLDLLDSERTLFSMRMEQIDTYVRYLKTTAELERALGVTYLREIDEASR